MSDEIKYSEVKPTRTSAVSGKKISEAAKRAIKEAELRRAKGDKNLPKEYNGRKGLEPTRYSDWENKGITSDF